MVISGAVNHPRGAFQKKPYKNCNEACLHETRRELK